MGPELGRGSARESAPDERLREAVQRFQRRDFAGAAALCDAILAAAPQHAEARTLAGKLALVTNRPAAAAEHLSQAAALAPPSYDVLSCLGSSYIQLGRFAEAAAAFRAALPLRPDFKPAHLNLAAAYRGQGEFAAAIAVLEPLAAQGTADPDLLRDLAELHLLAGRAEAGIAFYRRAVAAAPEALPARRALAQALKRHGRVKEAIEHYRRIAESWPQDAVAQTDLGVALAAAGAAEEAIATLRRALALHPGDRVARAALGQLFREQVPNWHFTMLNHAERNAVYDAALRRAVTAESLVLDIGTGSGLLAMMAARAGARQVYACEANPVIAEKAREIIRVNGLAERITVIAKHSRQLRIGEDLPRKADVLVSEILDAGLIGEGVLLTLAHARHALVAEGAKIIPQSGVLKARLVESAALYRQDRVDRAAGFDVSAFNEFARYNWRTLDLRHFDHRLLSPPVALFRFDLTGGEVRPEEKTVEFPVTEDGTCHALMSWFELEVDAQGRLSSGPAAGGVDWHWMQLFHFWERPRRVAPGQTIRVAASHDLLHLLLAPEPGPPD